MAYVRDIQCYLKLSTWGDFQVVSGTETCNFNNRVTGFFLGFIVGGEVPSGRGPVRGHVQPENL